MDTALDIEASPPSLSGTFILMEKEGLIWWSIGWVMKVRKRQREEDRENHRCNGVMREDSSYLYLFKQKKRGEEEKVVNVGETSAELRNKSWEKPSCLRVCLL